MFTLKPVPLLFLLALLLVAVAVKPVSAQDATPTPEPQAALLSPGGGEGLQGVVVINGTSGIAGFLSAEVSFAYQNDPTRTWFLMSQSETPVESGALATWDTTTISDGTYRLRLVVYLQNGQVKESLVEGVRVRNYTPLETSTPAPTIDSQALVTPERATPTPTATPLPDFAVVARTPAAQPTNPVQVTAYDLGSSAVQGVLVVVGLLAAGGVYIMVKSTTRR